MRRRSHLLASALCQPGQLRQRQHHRPQHAKEHAKVGVQNGGLGRSLDPAAQEGSGPVEAPLAHTKGRKCPPRLGISRVGGDSLGELGLRAPSAAPTPARPASAPTAP